MEELIRKQDALNIKFKDGILVQEDGIYVRADKVVEGIKALPPVQPNHGKWVFKTVFPNDTSEFPMGYLVCSECGSKHPNKTPCNFCDNCGADMRGEANAGNN